MVTIDEKRFKELLTSLQYKPLYNINRSEKWGKKIQTAGYNGARTVHNNSINKIITTLKLFLEHENQLWRLNDSILTNKAGVWNPSKKWKFIDIDSIFVHIEDSSSNKNVLTAKKL